jgi:hypothetical protein
VKRLVSTFLLLTLVLLLLGLCFVWIRSYFRADAVSHESLHKELNIFSNRGIVLVAILWGPKWQLTPGTWHYNSAPPKEFRDDLTKSFGFGFEGGAGPSAGTGYRVICIPYWFITGLIAIPTLWMGWRRVRRRIGGKGFPISSGPPHDSAQPSPPPASL